MTNQVIHGDCMDVMREMEDNSIDSIITDPPYHLGSISKRFTKTSLGDDNDTAASARNGSNQYARLSTGFMGARWDGGGIAFQPELWAEMLRVAKPGATLMAFGGTRTHHRLMVAIEDAGWEIRDCLMFLYGAGFPKSHNISKAIDRAAGKEREVVGEYSDNGRRCPKHQNTHASWEGKTMVQITAPATAPAKTFDGYGTGLKPAYEPIIYAQKPIESTYANNAMVWNVAGLNIDGGRISTQDDLNGGQYSGAEKQNGAVYGDHRNLTPEQYKQPQGRWPANVLLSHAEGCVRRGEKRVRGAYSAKGTTKNAWWNPEGEDKKDWKYTDPNGLETVADWECVDGCPIKILDEQAGVRSAGHWPRYNKRGQGIVYGKFNEHLQKEKRNETGSASRFFYTAKAPNREKWFYCQLCQAAYPNKERDNHGHDIDQSQRKHIVAHPTVKPQSILEYLCILTKTPTGGIVLDPFAGSGTTGLACLETGRDFILIEKESDYYQTAKARVEAAMNEPRQAELW